MFASYFLCLLCFVTNTSNISECVKIKMPKSELKMEKWISGVIFKDGGHLWGDGCNSNCAELNPCQSLTIVLVLKHLGDRHVLYVLEIVHGLHFDDCIVVVVLQVDVQLGGKPDPVHGVVPLLLPLPWTHLHLLVGEQALVEQILDEFVLQVFSNEDQLLTSVSVRPFLVREQVSGFFQETTFLFSFFLAQ